MKSVTILCFVGVFFCLLNGAFGQLRGACPLANPVRCSNGTCVATSSLCNTNPCGGVTPFLCSNGSCAISAFYCNCPGVICFDGSCKTTIDQCPILQGCPEDRPQRCPDGSCDVFNSTCAGKQGPTCPTGLTKCVDGICRSIDLCNALPYYGCPRFQCPRGICATAWTTCECSPGVVLCYDGTCTPVGPGGWPNCTITAPAFVSPQNLTTTVSSSSSSTTSVGTTSSSSTTVLTVSLPANSTSGTLSLRKRDTTLIDTVQVDGCSSPLWAGRTAIDDAGNQYDAVISSPVVTASFGTGQTTLNPGKEATLQFENVYLEENGTYCVAGLNEVTQRWECLSNTVINRYEKRTSSLYGSVSGTTTEFGKKFGVLKTQVYQCTPTCPEQQCDDEVYDLKTADGLITVGTLSVNNKDDIEVQFEINLYEDRTNSNYGWKLAGILVEVGEKLLQIDYSTHSDKYREYTTVQFSDAFPNGGSQCGLDVPFLFVGSVLDDGPCPSKRTEPTCNPINRVVYAYPRAKRTSGPSAPYPSNPSAFTQTYPMCCTCKYRSELISNWGRTCSVTPVGCYRDSRFNIAYPRGMVVGCPTGNTITFTSAAAVASFLDNRDAQFGSPAPLTTSYTNPATTEARSLAGYITSVSLSDRMDRLDKNWADSCNWLRGVYVCGGTCASNFAGKKIREILDIANEVLGGCRSDYSPSALVSCLEDIERSFDGGRRVDSFAPRGYSVTPCN